MYYNFWGKQLYVIYSSAVISSFALSTCVPKLFFSFSLCKGYITLLQTVYRMTFNSVTLRSQFYCLPSLAFLEFFHVSVSTSHSEACYHKMNYKFWTKNRVNSLPLLYFFAHLMPKNQSSNALKVNMSNASASELFHYVITDPINWLHIIRWNRYNGKSQSYFKCH